MDAALAARPRAEQAPGPSLRLPRTGTRRGAVTFAKLLDRVQGQGASGFDWQGRLLRPGASIPLDLIQGRAAAVILERSEAQGAYDQARRRRRWESLYVLWLYQAAGAEWIEVARVQGESSQALADLAPRARRALRQAMGVVPVIAELAEHIDQVLEAELARVEGPQRAALLAIVHDLIAHRIAS